MIYKIRIQIEEVDGSKGRHRNLGLPYEGGKFNTETAARKFVENELMIIRPINTKLRNACRATMKFLNGLGQANLMTTLQNLQALRKKLNEAISRTAPAVDDSCPKCGADSDEREFTGKDFLDSEAIHMHYTCNKCSSEITEEFTLTDVFIDKGQQTRMEGKSLWDTADTIQVTQMYCFPSAEVAQIKTLS